MDNHFIEYRQKAIDWLNSNRDFYIGVQILEESKFRPGVVMKLKSQGITGPETEKRLIFQMRELVKAWHTEADQIQTTVADSQEMHVKIQNVTILSAANLPDKTLPEYIDKIVKLYADYYKRRDILHKQMSELPEDNESSTISQRKACSDEIEELTDEMERLYPYYEAYTKQGIIPDNTIFEPKNDDSLKTDKQPVGIDSLSKDELKKLRKSVATKLSRANNMLNYQTETKGQDLNPMPESPKRVKYETKVHHLTEELKDIDYQIAKMG